MEEKVALKKMCPFIAILIGISPPTKPEIDDLYCVGSHCMMWREHNTLGCGHCGLAGKE